MLLLPQNLTGKLQLYGFVSRLFISVNLFLFHRRLAKLSHLLKYLYLWLKKNLPERQLWMEILRKKLLTPPSLGILRFTASERKQYFVKEALRNIHSWFLTKRHKVPSASWSIWSNYIFSFLQLCTLLMPLWCCDYDETYKLRLVILNFLQWSW